MSHDATNWAIKQRGIKPALKVVLWNLCDRYHPDNGCFPSQDTLAADCEVPRSTLNVYLGELENMGLIAREQRREKGSNRQERTRYRFPFEPDFPATCAKKPGPESGHGAESRNAGEPSPENGKSRVQNLDSNLVREPVREPVIEREGEREALEGALEPLADERGETRASMERDFWRLVKDWPNFAGMPKEPAKAPWLALTADERAEALARFPDWLSALKRQGKAHPPAPSTYLREKLWRDIPVSAEPAAGPKLAAPYGKLWMAERLADLMRPHYGPVPGLTGFERREAESGRTDAATLMREKIRKHGWTKVNAMHERAAEQKGYPCDIALLPACEGFRQVATDGELYAAWKREHERRGWPDLDATRPPKWVWLPDVMCGVEELDAAVQRSLDEFQMRLREVRGNEHAA